MKQYICILLALVSASCNTFLKEHSQDLAYGKTVNDLEEVLLGDGYVKGNVNYPWLHLMDDDLEKSILTSDNTRDYSNYFTWAQYPSSENNEVVKDKLWVDIYKNISTVNVVLAKLKEVGAEEIGEQRLRGECHFLRGYFYWFLANVYAKPYVKATAKTDLGMVLKTTEFIEDGYFSRNTLQQTYDLILSDLKIAVQLLKGQERQTALQADYSAAQALLSRVYLHTGDYELALEAADEAMSGGYVLLDYNEFAKKNADQGGDIWPVSVIYGVSPETLFSQGGNAFGGGVDHWGMASPNGLSATNKYRASEELIGLYSKEMAKGEDLRRTFYIYNTGHDKPNKIYLQKINTTKEKIVSSEFLIRLPEVMLNKAEALAMLNRDGEAQQVVEDLRVKRIDAGGYQPLAPRTGEKLVELIRDERRKELCGEGHRWFDLRRYAVHPKYPSTKEIIHDDYTYDTSTRTVVYSGSYKLNRYENEPAYVVPIPVHAIEYNNGVLLDNDERPERESFTR